MWGYNLLLLMPHSKPCRLIKQVFIIFEEVPILFLPLDLKLLIGNVSYLSVKSEFGSRKIVKTERLQTSCQLMAICFNV